MGTKVKILHYALGFPPYRTGGLTKFCIDLMVRQNEDGHQVALLWPGQMGFLNHKVLVKDWGVVAVNGKESGIRSYEVINPLPISYDEGINQFDAFMLDGGLEEYREVLNEFIPDIIHIHTLMGLHKSFLTAAKEKGIRLVFTTHDFFPICPKVTMFRHGEICSCIQSCDSCGTCNVTALGIKKIQILQSQLYRRLKDSTVVKKIRKQHRDEYLSKCSISADEAPIGTAADFKRLRYYYLSFLELMDMIHYNSSVTRSAYESFFNLPNSCVIGISHSDIVDCRKKKDFSGNLIRIRYLGPYGGAKGFFYLGRRLINCGKPDSISA